VIWCILVHTNLYVEFILALEGKMIGWPPEICHCWSPWEACGICFALWPNEQCQCPNVSCRQR